MTYFKDWKEGDKIVALQDYIIGSSSGDNATRRLTKGNTYTVASIDIDWSKTNSLKIEKCDAGHACYWGDGMNDGKRLFEKYAEPSKSLVGRTNLKTREGNEVRIYADDGMAPYCLHGAIKVNDQWKASVWRSDGRFSGIESANDIIIPIAGRWVNVYKNNVGAIYESKEEADLQAHWDRQKCINLDEV